VRAIRVPRAFDGERPLDGGLAIIVDEGRIVAVEPASVPLPAHCPVAEYPDATALPGLIDTHVHLCGDSRLGALDRLADYDAARPSRTGRSCRCRWRAS
jgi:imidazolonepropionase-like amidohydrolase